MDLNHALEGFHNWSQTTLGAAIIGPLVVAFVIWAIVSIRRFFRSIPDRFDRWLKRRVGLM